MGSQPQSHGFARQPLALRGNGAQHVCGQIQAVEKNCDVWFLAVRIFEDGKENFFDGLVAKAFNSSAVADRARSTSAAGSGGIALCARRPDRHASRRVGGRHIERYETSQWR